MASEHRQDDAIQDFVGNYRALSYTLDAYGLGDQVNNTAPIREALEALMYSWSRSSMT